MDDVIVGVMNGFSEDADIDVFRAQKRRDEEASRHDRHVIRGWREREPSGLARTPIRERPPLSPIHLSDVMVDHDFDGSLVDRHGR